MTTTRRAYAGGAKAGRLLGPITTTDNTAACDALVGWPDGTDGHFAAVIGKGLPNEEKVLCESRTGGNLTIAVRGYDDTAPQNHAATETVEHCHTATDDDEANEHSSNVYGHGVAVDDRIVGEKKAATLQNKTLDGTKNTFTNIPSAASPETSDRLDAVEDANDAQDQALANRYTKAQVDTMLASESQARADGDANRYTKAEADAQFLDATEADALFLTQAEGDGRYARQFTDSGWVTSTAGYVAKSGWAILSVRHRILTQGAVTFVDLYLGMRRTGAALPIGTKGDVAQSDMVTIPAALRPSSYANMSGPVSGGRLAAAYVGADGVVTLSAAGGTADIAVNETLSFRGFYIL